MPIHDDPQDKKLVSPHYHYEKWHEMAVAKVGYLLGACGTISSYYPYTAAGGIPPYDPKKDVIIGASGKTSNTGEAYTNKVDCTNAAGNVTRHWFNELEEEARKYTANDAVYARGITLFTKEDYFATHGGTTMNIPKAKAQGASFITLNIKSDEDYALLKAISLTGDSLYTGGVHGFYRHEAQFINDKMGNQFVADSGWAVFKDNKGFNGVGYAPVDEYRADDLGYIHPNRNGVALCIKEYMANTRDIYSATLETRYVERINKALGYGVEKIPEHIQAQLLRPGDYDRVEALLKNNQQTASAAAVYAYLRDESTLRINNPQHALPRYDQVQYAAHKDMQPLARPEPKLDVGVMDIEARKIELPAQVKKGFAEVKQDKKKQLASLRGELANADSHEEIREIRGKMHAARKEFRHKSAEYTPEELQQGEKMFTQNKRNTDNTPPRV